MNGTTLRWLGLGASVALALALVLAEYHHLFSPVLFNDDGWWIGKPMLRQTVTPPGSYVLYHELIFLLGQFGSPVLMRLVTLFAHAAAAVPLMLLFLAAGWQRLPAALLAVALLALPVFSTQHVFISASHTLMGLPFALLGVYALISVMQRGASTGLGRFLGAGLAFAAAALLSPNYTLLPLLLLLAPLLCPRAYLANRQLRIAYGTLAALVVAAMLQTLVFTPHVYAQLDGWTSMSLSQPFVALKGAVRLIYVRVGGGGVVGQLLYLASGALCVAATMMVIGRAIAGQAPAVRALQPLWFLPAVLLLAGALTFAPAAFLTFLSDRYCFVPLVLSAAAGLSLLGRLTFDRWQRPVLQAGLFGLVLASTVTGAVSGAARFSGFESLHYQMATLFAVDEPQWKPRAQIVVFVPDELPGNGPANAYIHFSTGYLRYLSGREDIIGLIGPASAARRYPIVAQPNEFGSGGQYWGYQGAKYHRLTMVGVAPDRPLYLYHVADDGLLRRAAETLFPADDPGAIVRVPFGARPDAHAGAAESGLCSELGRDGLFVWPAPGLPASALAGPRDRYTACSLASVDVGYVPDQPPVPTAFTPEPGDLVELAVTLDGAALPSWNGRYTPTAPAMVALADGFAIYGLGDRVRVVDRENDASYLGPFTPNSTIRFFGVEGCRVEVSLDGQSLGRLSGGSLRGTLNLGTGFLERRWASSLQARYRQSRLGGCEAER